ncbi:carbohydrate esterase family 12 protein [Athelia psychrophila]|uniref:Carbohydrate esterase family 12 protein n=1 Tax=Athelia psychrophila TaxID=1759441 RepID=A0A166ST14_9AGAM|nr:carbohydrate esterase family 12 protein [Fibularhizoctonia sp. CBS 109695]
MALHAASEGIQGWGVEIVQYLQDITVVNSAVSGTSARSYARDGWFYNVIHQVKAGDYVIIEFGHNDGGGNVATSSTADLVGESLTDTQTVTLTNGTAEVGMIDQIVAKGATPIISSQTPDDPYEGSTTIIYEPSRFVGYALDAAAAKGVAYVDHFTAAVSLFSKYSAATVDAYYPLDQYLHTNTVGATQMAWAFLSGLKCSSAQGALASYVNSVGEGAGARCSYP